MPYNSVAELPAWVRKLTPKKQKTYMAAFNAAHKEYADESKAFATAAAAIKEAFDLPMEGVGIELTEAMAGTRIDKDKGIIEGVLLLTGDKVSKNKTLYTKKVLQEALTRYEGAKMYLDHPASGVTVRSVRDYGGVYRNVRLEEGKRLRADLHLVPNEDVRSTVIPIAEQMPAGVGLSIRDRGHGHEENGVFLVEGFAGKGPYSIDLVMEASVNETLFESNQGGSEDMDLSKVTLAELKEANPALVEQITNEARTASFKEVEEQIKAGKEAPMVVARGKKLIALAESGLPKEVLEKVRPVVEQDSTSVENAEAIIKAQKEIVEALKVIPAGKKPAVRGAGAANDTILEEAELPSDDATIRALES
jgi:cation transport regulator ChaB